MHNNWIWMEATSDNGQPNHKDCLDGNLCFTLFGSIKLKFSLILIRLVIHGIMKYSIIDFVCGDKFGDYLPSASMVNVVKNDGNGHVAIEIQFVSNQIRLNSLIRTHRSCSNKCSDKCSSNRIDSTNMRKY